ncbi:MAG: hypothetical protein GY791_00760 [Alphaproteobacteria bacterium]|nr:hypothetical protein [Alphaproteobacteria bacterium]
MRPANKEYQYEVDQCSVSDKALLTEFRAKRSEWKSWLERDVHHNIWGQIHAIMWNDAAYRSLNEARRFASANEPTAAVNGMFGELVDRGYVSTQVLDLCKITDRSNNDPKKGVISLRRLLDDIREHRRLLTRENFVAYDGLPYDYAAAGQAYFESLAPKERGKARWVATRGPDAWGMSERVHNAFDKLSGIVAENRTRTDLIHEEVFVNVDAWFDLPILRKLRTYRNKYIGHAADAISRDIEPLDRLGLSLDEIADAQRVVIRIATAIGSSILYDCALGGVVPTPQFNQFENLEKPVIPAVNMEEIGTWWHGHERERQSWLNEQLDLITGEVRRTT